MSIVIDLKAFLLQCNDRFDKNRLPVICIEEITHTRNILKSNKIYIYHNRIILKSL